jgi:PDZ domain-containing secreted protein
MFANLRKMIINLLSTKEEIKPIVKTKTFNEELEEIEERRIQNMRKSLASKLFSEKYEGIPRSTGVFHCDDLMLIQNQRALDEPRSTASRPATAAGIASARWTTTA